MSWSRLKSIACVSLLSVAASGCGFHPLYGDRAGKADVDLRLASIRVSSIPERAGQELTNQLRDSFNPDSQNIAAVYQLDVQLKTTAGDILTRSDGSAARTDTTVQANWTLRRLADGKVVNSGTSLSQNGHDILTNDYANLVGGQRDVETGIRAVESDIQTRVVIYLQTAS